MRTQVTDEFEILELLASFGKAPHAVHPLKSVLVGASDYRLQREVRGRLHDQNVAAGPGPVRTVSLQYQVGRDVPSSQRSGISVDAIPAPEEAG